MLVLVQAKEYVCCVDQDYVNRLVKVYNQSFASIDDLRNTVFGHFTIPNQ